MKKFFRMVSMFVLAGATLAYTGCTDYGEDIEAINDRIDALETGTIADVQNQIKSMQSQIASLETAKAAAETAISKLQSTVSGLEGQLATLSAKADANASEIANLKSSISTINNTITSLTSRVSICESEIKAIKDGLSKYATLSYVDATFYTKEQAAKLLSDVIGPIQTDLGNAKTAISALEGKYDSELKISEILDKITAADNAAKAAQSDATAALGKINTLEAALGVYAQAGKLDDALKSKLNIADFDEAFDTQLEIALADGGKISLAISKAINDATTKINARIDEVLGIIERRLTSIAFVPEYYYDGVPSILFETIAYDGLSDTDEEAVNDDHYEDAWWEINSEYANYFENFASALATAKYRLNPRNVGADCADFSFVGDKADYVFTRAEAPAAPVSIEGNPSYDENTGYVIFQVKKNEKINLHPADSAFNNYTNEDKNLDIVALKAVLKKGLTENEKESDTKPEVYSEYVHVNEVVAPATALAISDKIRLESPVAELSLPEGAELKQYQFAKDGHSYVQTFAAAKDSGYVYEMPFDKEFDLGSLVATCYNYKVYTDGLEGETNHKSLDLEKYGFTYRFSVAQTEFVVEDGDSKVDQQGEIVCLDSEKGIFSTVKDAAGKYVTARVGRTPIVRVDLMHGDNIVTRAFIKLVITGQRENNMNIYDSTQKIVLSCPDATVYREISEDKLQELYDKLHITKEEFWAIYGGKPYYTYTYRAGKQTTLIPQPTKDDNLQKISWSVTHADAGKVGAGVRLTGIVTLVNKRVLSALPKYIQFIFWYDFKLPEPEVTAEIKDVFWKGSALQANVNVPVSTTDGPDNCLFNTPIAIQPWTKLEATNLPCVRTDVYGFRISRLFNINNDGKFAEWTTTSGVNITPANKTILASERSNTEYYITLDKSNNKVKAALNSDNGLMAEVQWYAKAQSGDEFVLHTFLVNFIRPLNFMLPEGLEVTDAVDGGDVVEFQDKAMLTDWRGNLVFGPEYKNVTLTDYFWNKACSPADHAEYQPEYQRVKTPAQYVFETETVTIKTGETYYEASCQLWKNQAVIEWYNKYGDADRVLGEGGRPKGTWVKSEVMSATGRTKNEAEAILRYWINAMDEHYLDGAETCGRKADPFTTKALSSNTEVKFDVISDVTYTPAVYETVAGKWVYSECNPKPGDPANGEVYTEGQRIGCWEYQKYQWEEVQTVPGQYWNYYGPMNGVILDLGNVSTNLPDGKLPAGASLQQSGNTVKYMNVQSPIQYSYYIYIPATFNYGWGTLAETLVIKVNPVGTVAE
ncbi:MAG: hypothetical protein ACI3ZC_06030 [Candidatus Cryptobacteroides sp.]